MSTHAKILQSALEVTPALPFRYEANRRLFFEQCKTLPKGFFVAGDALASFDPVYGQGTAVASWEARLVREYFMTELDEDVGLQPHRIFKQLSRVVDVAWNTTTSVDFAFGVCEGLLYFGIIYI